MKAPTDVSTILEPEKEVISFRTKSFWDVAMPSHSEIHLMEDKSKLDGRGESSGNKSVKPRHINVVAAGLILLLSFLVGFVLFNLKGWGLYVKNISQNICLSWSPKYDFGIRLFLFLIFKIIKVSHLNEKL